MDVFGNFLENDDISDKNKNYIMGIFKHIEKWNMGFLINDTNEIPLLYLKTNIIESINNVIKQRIL